MASPNKKQIIKSLLDWTGQKGAARTKARKRLEAKTLAQLRPAYAKARKQRAAAQAQGKKPAKPKGKGKSRPKVSVAAKKRAGQIVRAIASGKIKAKRYSKPSEAPGKNARERYAKFLAQYKGVRISSKRGKPAAKSMKSVYGQLSGKKQPYYLSKGYHVKAFNVGGGPSGPGVVRRMAGSKAKSFWELTEAQRKKVCTFLNGPGASLRTRGAPKKCSVAALNRVKQQKAAKRATAGRKKGSSNWW